MKRMLLVLALLGTAWTSAQAQEDSVNTKRLRFLQVGGAVTYTGTLLALNEFWYKDFPRSSFHFFNDNRGWLRMDKIGHLSAANGFAIWGMEAMSWAGLPRKKAAWVGGISGNVFLTTIEVLDGFSAEWGFSWGDIAANAAGAAIVIVQEELWQEQRIIMKYSYFPEDYSNSFYYNHESSSIEGSAKGRANELYGTILAENIIKDYNGQTYWLSANLHAFGMNTPKWLNVAIGMGATGLAGASDKDRFMGPSGEFTDRTNQYLLSVDLDLSRIETNSKALKLLLRAFNIFKIPAPAIELNGKGALRLIPIHY